MDKDVEKACSTFRTYVRMLRKGINDTCYFFQDDGLNLTVFLDTFPKIDENYTKLFMANNLVPNEKIDAMEKFFENIFPPLDTSEVVQKVEPLIIEANATLQKRLSEIDMTKLDEKKKASYENIRKQIDSLSKPFEVEEIVDVIQLTKQMGNFFLPPIQVQTEDLRDSLEKYIAAFQINKAVKSLKAFVVPPKMTEEQAEIKRLNETIKKLNATIKEQKDQISKLQQEKMTFKRENIQLKKENEVYKQQNDDLVKRNNQMNNRLSELPAMRNALEGIAKLYMEENK
ncbi:hypothetical protein TRFO_02125 [Tritrichomonas foetus]|uniref:Uncharacterized protein n=1 Tax=Tritrichomonas foetus TaxID=1144522 RepID=A0A1J4J930_9EUKA|nr:hypothetical protein TRFO_02125 [Tritrichomonas foetus]|eukprot:OHS95193.1 hypothetical protein TRFO_02125 [Tritrichomonas foetus]